METTNPSVGAGGRSSMNLLIVAFADNVIALV